MLFTTGDEKLENIQPSVLQLVESNTFGNNKLWLRYTIGDGIMN